MIHSPRTTLLYPILVSNTPAGNETTKKNAIKMLIVPKWYVRNSFQKTSLILGTKLSTRTYNKTPTKKIETLKK